MSENFFNRWSRRKQALQQAGPPPSTPSSTDPAAVPQVDTLTPGPVQQDLQADPALPTLEDVQTLTPTSDFQPFMQQGVGAEVRNAALKKLFADPHFNVMDGLDIYIDDYSLPDPLPAGMLREMASAQFMKLVAPQAPERQPAAPGALAGGTRQDTWPQDVAQSDAISPAAPAQSHDDPDMQLQPDPAPADPAPGPDPG
jgi:hypothetical protein